MTTAARRLRSTAICSQALKQVSGPHLYLVHGVEQLGELVETLPVLAGVLLALHDGLPQLLDVRHTNLLEHRLTLQTVLWHWRTRTLEVNIWTVMDQKRGAVGLHTHTHYDVFTAQHLSVRSAHRL